MKNMFGETLRKGVESLAMKWWRTTLRRSHNTKNAMRAGRRMSASHEFPVGAAGVRGSFEAVVGCAL